MSLLNTNSTITTSSIYPDRITINYQFPIQSRTRLLNLGASVLGDIGFVRCNGNVIRGRRHIPSTTTNADFTVSKPSAAAPLNVFASFNVLTEIRQRSTTTSAERPRSGGALNWLPARLIGVDTRWIWGRAEELAFLLWGEAHGIAEQIASAVGAPHTELVHMSVRDVEMLVDFATADPHECVERLGPIFRRECKKQREHPYPAAHAVTGLEDDSLMVSGFIRDTRYKAYEKTDRRIRLECQLTSKALDTARIRRSLGGEGDMIEFLGRAATHVLPRFQALLQGLRPVAAHDPLELVANVCSATRRPDVARDLLRQLVRNGRVMTSFDPGLVSRLRQGGVLVRAERGVAVLAPRYRGAAGVLHASVGDFIEPTREVPR